MGVLSFAQIRYEPGTFTDNAGNKKDVLIRYEDLKDNPTSFQYKTEESAQPQQADLANVKSFEVYNRVKYLKASINVDQSSDDLNNLSTLKTPEYRKETIFLKILVDGKYKLYEYSSGSINRFFYSTENGEIKPLVYKMYQLDANKIAYNETYKSQLQDLKCNGVSQNYTNTTYTNSNLSKVFVKVNQCADPNFKVVEGKSKSKLNLSIRPRLNISSFEFDSSFTSKSTKMESNSSFGIGLELEYVFPFNRNKWAAIFEPNYQSYTGEVAYAADYIIGGKAIAKADFKSVDLPIGIRHYFFIDNSSKIFLNFVLNPSLDLNSTFVITRTDGSSLGNILVNPRLNFGFGIGYNYNNKFSAEIRYLTPRNTFNGDGDGGSKFKSINLAIGYNFF